MGRHQSVASAKRLIAAPSRRIKTTSRSGLVTRAALRRVRRPISGVPVHRIEAAVEDLHLPPQSRDALLVRSVARAENAT